MRKDTSFSERKLSRKEFSHKYWMDGEAEYQYHTADIEDGRDEREQFLINNDRALYDLYRELNKRHGELSGRAFTEFRKQEKSHKITTVVLSLVIAAEFFQILFSFFLPYI